MKITSIILFSFSACFLFASTALALTDIPDIVIDDYNDGTDNHSPALSSKTPIETITAKDIKESNAQTLDQLLQGKFGVQTNDLYGDGNHSNISIRGFGDNSSYNSLIMLDGQPLINPDLALPSISFIPLDEIEQIDIMPSSGGVLYGDQAVGGVINITTKKTDAKVRNVYADYGSFNTRKIGGQFSDKFGNGFGYGINVLHYYTDNYRDHNNYQSNNINTILSYNSKTLDSYLRYWKVNNHMLLPNGLTAEQVAENRQQADSDIPFNNQDIDFWQMAIKKDLNDKNILNLKAYAENMSGIGAYAYNDAPRNFNENRSAYNFNPELSSAFDFLDCSFIPTFGFELNSGEYAYDDNYYNSDSKQLEKSLYTQINTYLTKKLSTTIGVRTAESGYHLNNSSYTGDKDPINRANATDIEASYLITNSTKFFVKRADNYRFPKTDEQSWTETGEPLKTQTGISYETGLSYQKKTLRLLLEIYELDLKNEIMAVPIQDMDYYFTYNENLDPTQRRGIILNGELPLCETLKLQADLGFVDAKFSEGPYQGNRIPFVAANMTKIATIYSVKKYFDICLEGIYISSRYPANDVENKDNLLGGFTVYNLNFNYKKDPCDISLKINNLTDKQYYSYVTTTYDKSNSVSTTYYPAAGINMLLSIGVKF